MEPSEFYFENSGYWDFSSLDLGIYRISINVATLVFIFSSMEPPCLDFNMAGLEKETLNRFYSNFAAEKKNILALNTCVKYGPYEILHNRRQHELTSHFFNHKVRCKTFYQAHSCRGHRGNASKMKKPTLICPPQDYRQHNFCYVPASFIKFLPPQQH